MCWEVACIECKYGSPSVRIEETSWRAVFDCALLVLSTTKCVLRARQGSSLDADLGRCQCDLNITARQV